MADVIEYHEELEHDLLPEHDLLDFWRGTLTPRRLALLIGRLPASSATLTAINPDETFIASWDATNYQLADLFDLFGRAHFKNMQPYPRPKSVIARRDADNERRRRLIERYEARNPPPRRKTRAQP